MSIHKSLRQKAALARSRNVFTRWERVQKLKEAGTWSDEKQSSVYGLKKVRTTLKGAKKKKKVKEKKEGDAGAAPAEGAAAAPAAAGGKAAAPAAGAKPAAAAGGDKKAAAPAKK